VCGAVDEILIAGAVR